MNIPLFKNLPKLTTSFSVSDKGPPAPYCPELLSHHCPFLQLCSNSTLSQFQSKQTPAPFIWSFLPLHSHRASLSRDVLGTGRTQEEGPEEQLLDIRRIRRIEHLKLREESFKEMGMVSYVKFLLIFLLISWLLSQNY